MSLSSPNPASQPQHTSSSNPENPSKHLKTSGIGRPILTEIDTSFPSSQVESIKLKDGFLKGFGPSKFQSSATLQNSIQSVSFPKALRFAHNFSMPPDSDALKNDKSLSTLSQRGALIGYGSKACYPSYTLKMARDNPAPNNYMLKSEFDQINKGKSFGLSYKAYAKVKLPHIDIITPEIASLIPGPGYYSLKGDEFAKNKTKALLVGKGKTENDMIKEKAPPPNYYSPKSDLVINGRYKNMTFGSSNRNTFQENHRNTPGPGTYSFKSKFDQIVEKNRFFKGFHEQPIA
jgi:hypothetical protein